jgi:hypothetical protein
MQFAYQILTSYWTMIKFTFKKEIMSECNIMALSEFMLLTYFYSFTVFVFAFCTDTKILVIVMKMSAHEV